MAKDKEPFVSGAYDPKDDAQNRPLQSIQKITTDTIKRGKVRRYYGSKATPETVALTKRITGEKDD